MTNAMIGERVSGDHRSPMPGAMKKVHELKTWPEFFQHVWNGDKPFELRKDDRGFRAGEALLLREYVAREDRYTNRVIRVQISFVLSGFPGLLPDYVILGLDMMTITKVIYPTGWPDRSEQTNTQAKP